MFIFNRFEYFIFKIFFTFSFGLCSLFFSCPALAQNLVPQAYEGLDSGTVALYPIYALVNADFVYSQNNTSFPSSVVNFFPFQAGSKSTLGLLRRKELMKAIIDYEGFQYVDLSNIVATLEVSGSSPQDIQPDGILIVDCGRPTNVTFFPPNYPQNYLRNICLFNLYGYVLYRPSQEVNCYDVFYCLNIAPAAGSFPSSRVWDLQINEAAQVARIFSTETNITLEAMRTYQMVGSFSVELLNSSHEFVDTSKFSLPLEINDFTRTINFSLNTVKNYYWNNWDLSDVGNTVPSFPDNYSNVLVPAYRNVSNWPLYSPAYSLATGDSSYTYDNQRNTTFNFLGALDTDGGGMKDYAEWYLTKHNILDPADDTDIPPEIDDEPELPPSKPGETVVDVGTDTQDRYKYYWDEKTGDESDLKDFSPPVVEPPSNFGPKDFYFNKIYSDTKDVFDSSFDENSKFKTTYDSTFSNLNAEKLSWTFSPSINSSMVQFPLPDVSINPDAVFETDYGMYFRIFRGCLLLTEFLIFCFGLYKLAIGALSGSSDNSSSGEE